eukprot:Skav227823  [mRNA]  locus=scaffold948:300105:300698:+ [translate_table: standard]
MGFTVPELATFIWTLAEKLDGREICVHMNDVVRQDDSEMLKQLMPLIRAINKNLVTRESQALAWPKENITYRGTGIPSDQLQFFFSKKQYRCPMFLATSFDRELAEDFARRAKTCGKSMVLFRIHYHVQYRCKHVNYISAVAELSTEEEFLFPPYSAFTVRSPHKKEGEMYVIDIEAAYDNKDEEAAPERLPLSPWH